jgi:acetyl-CoA acetyltransferase
LKEKVVSDVSIVGVGIHPFGRFDKSYEEIGAYAASEALKDAGVSWQDIQAAYLSRMYLPATSGARVLRRLGGTDIPIVDIEAACASGGRAASGRAGHPLRRVRSGDGAGRGKMPRGFMDPSMIYSRWQIEMGMS